MAKGRVVQSPVTLVLGAVLLAAGAYGGLRAHAAPSLIPMGIGCCLIYLGWRGGRAATILLGHAFIVAGCYLVTWGIYLLPHSDPVPAHIFGRPLFWGLISIFGGICANYHGFCNCVMKSPARQARPESS